jgi:hypothetical protein
MALVGEPGSYRFDHDVPVEIPPTVEKLLLARIDRLTPACHDVLTSASALGRTFGLPLLEGVLGASPQDALHELQRLELVRETRRWPQPEYRFRHTLIQEAAYRTILAEPRRALHRKAAEWLEQQHAANLDEVLGVLAYHWLAAEDEDRAMAYLLRAGDKAREDYALDEAIAHYRALSAARARGHGRNGARPVQARDRLHTDALRRVERRRTAGPSSTGRRRSLRSSPDQLQDGVDRPPQARRSGARSCTDIQPVRCSTVSRPRPSARSCPRSPSWN